MLISLWSIYKKINLNNFMEYFDTSISTRLLYGSVNLIRGLKRICVGERQKMPGPQIQNQRTHQTIPIPVCSERALLTNDQVALKALIAVRAP